MQSLKLFCFILGLGAVSSAQADFIGVKAGIDYWNYSADLSNPASALPQAQLEDDHGMSFSVAVEHPIPFLPNAKIKHTNLQAESNQSLAGVKSHQLDLDYSDFILYYEILDNVVSADVGLGAKLLNGKIQQNFTQNTEVNWIVYYPIEKCFAKLTDSQVSDAQVELKYDFVDTLLVDVGAKAGYRILDIQLEEGSDQETKLKFKGPYIGLEAHF